LIRIQINPYFARPIHDQYFPQMEIDLKSRYLW